METARRVFVLALIATVSSVFVTLQSTRIAGQLPKHNKSAEFQRQVENLLNRLNDDLRSVRTRAEQELLHLGPTILPFLPTPKLTPTVSVRAAVRRIRIKVEQRKARRSVLSSQVTLQGKFQLNRVLEQIQTQSDNSIDKSGLTPRVLDMSVTIDYQRQPFWRVMDNLVSRANLQYNFHTNSNGLKLELGSADGNGDKNVVSYSGAFRIEAKPARVRMIFGDDGHRLLRVPVLLTAEPRLRPLVLKYSAADISATTDDRVPLKPQNPEASYEIPLGTGETQLRPELNFTVPVSSVPLRLNLRGTFVMQIAAGTERIAFTDLPNAQGVARRRGGVTVVLKKANFSRGPKGQVQARLQVGVSYDFGGPEFESHRTWIYHNQVYLQTKDGRSVDYDGLYTGRQSNGAIIVEYQFESLVDKPINYHLIYEAPTLITNIPIELQISKLPIE